MSKCEDRSCALDEGAHIHLDGWVVNIDTRFEDMPYCISRRADGAYILLTRKYAVYGTGSSDHSTAHGVSVKLTPADAAKISWEGSRDVKTIYLYSDRCAPGLCGEYEAAYRDRLDYFMSLPRC